tara:strand:+ start:106 stop:885 length:780 start_codon:yes stop_codon:yes gene_type:complete
MSKKFTILVIPDDDSETSSYSFSRTFIKIAICFSLITILASIAIIVKTVPNISKFDSLNKKYNVLAKERIKVLELMGGLEKLNQMDEFVRNSLGSELNFSDTPEIVDSVLMLIPENHLISLSDNIPSLAPIEGFISKRMESTFSNIDILHGGIDIVASEGTPIRATSSGVVVFSSWTYEMGNLIIIYHGDDYFTHYGHNQQNIISRLDIVKKGDVIGYVGNTGISSGPHLHFEIWKGDKSIDPLIYFPQYQKKDLTFKK